MGYGLTYFRPLADLSKDPVEKVFLGRLEKYAWFAWYRTKRETRGDCGFFVSSFRRVPYGAESTGAKTRRAFWCKDVPDAVRELVAALRAQGRATSETVESILAGLEPLFRKLDPAQPGFDNNAYLAFSASWRAEALAAVKKAGEPLATPVAKKRTGGRGQGRKREFEVTQSDVAERLGVGVKTVSNWERGVTQGPPGYSEDRRRTREGFISWADCFERNKEAADALARAARRQRIDPSARMNGRRFANAYAEDPGQ